jgi:glycosyltransferase involved in cell wall biosynthesis
VRALTQPHVVVDARMIADGGIGTYLQNIVPAVARRQPSWRFTVLTSASRFRQPALEALPNVALRRCDARIYGVREQLELPLRIPADASLFWAPHYNFPLLVSQPFVVTIHDVCHLALAEMNGGPLRHAYASFMLHTARRRARGLLFDSEFSLQEMSRLVGHCNNAVVSRLAVDDDWWNAKTLAPERPFAEPYLVYVGNMKRHKNVPLLVNAFRDASRDLPHRLVLIGRGTGLRADPDVVMVSDDRVQFAGELPQDQLRRYVAHADAFVTASRYEGFGLPALEAMAAGVPCMVSRAGSLPEICGDAAIYCDPADAASVAQGIRRIVGDVELRASLVARGFARAREFSWERCATQTAAVLERALA